MPIERGASVGALATKFPAARDVLEKYGIDYYCHGQRPLDEACTEAGVPVERVIPELDIATADARDDGTDWSTAALRDLIQHITATHHEFLKRELPKISGQLKAVQFAHAGGAALLGRLQKTFAGFVRELDLHVQKEEAVLFPIIERLESAASRGGPLPALPFGPIENPIGVMEAEHTASDEELRDLSKLIRDCSGSGVPLPELTVLAEELRSLELDLHLHIHLENNILFPRTIALGPTTVARTK